MATGVVIGAFVGSPVVAMPLALASHFALDMLPHYGNDHNSRRFKALLIFDAALVTALTIGLLVSQPHKWLMMLVCGMLAMSPDLMWVPEFIRGLRNKEAKARNKIMHFHQRIQWGERVWGLVVEAAWIMVLVPMCFAIMR